MPQPRSLGRTAAGRTNRSLAPARNDDGSYATASHAATAKSLHTNTQHLHPTPMQAMLNPSAALAATSHVPRSTLALNRSYPDRPMAQVPPPRATASPQVAAPHTARVEGSAPARTPAHLKAAAAQAETARVHKYQLASERSTLSDAPIQHSASTFVNHDQVPMGEDDATPSGVYFTSTTDNFGSGSGLPGARGQRWVPRKGVTDFLSKLHVEGEQKEAQTAKAGDELSPAELNSNSLITPAHFKHKIDLCYNNIRPETPSSRLNLPHSNRTVVQVSKPLTEVEKQQKEQHEKDLRAVRKAIRTLGARASNLNYREWFRGVEEVRGNDMITSEQLLAILPKMGVGLTNANQEKLLLNLAFDGESRADFLTLIPRLLGEKAPSGSEISQFLDYWKHLPAPHPKQDPNPTAVHLIQQMKSRIDTRGLNSFLQGMGFSTRDALPRKQFMTAVQRLNIHLPAQEETKLFRLLDPRDTGFIDYKQFFTLAELPTHQLQEHHSFFKQITKNLEDGMAKEEKRRSRGAEGLALDAHSTVDESKENVNDDASSPARASFLDRSPRAHPWQSSFNNASQSARHAPPATTAVNADASSSTNTLSDRPEIVALNLPLSISMSPPLFTSVQTARAATKGSAPINYQQEVKSAREGYEYSVYAPRAAPARYSKTHQPMHTPMSTAGGVGRPISATTRAKVDAQRQQLRLPELKTMDLPSLPLHRIGERLALEPAIPQGRNAMFASESERFTPREEAIRTMQQADKDRKNNIRSARAQKLDLNEQRVLARYEADELTLQAQQARSILDKVYQKKGYMESLQVNYRKHDTGKRIVNKIAEQQLREMGFDPQQQSAGFQVESHHSSPPPAAPAAASETTAV